MPRQVATYDDVKQAAVTLISRGDTPTLERLRAIIGHGSFSTIRAHYQKFQDELKQQPKALWPATVPESLLSVVETLWQTAMEAAEAQYQTLKDQAETATAAAELTARAAQEAQAAAEEHRQTLEQKLAAAMEHSRSLEKALAVAEDRLTTRNAALDEHQQRTDELHTALSTAKAAADTDRQQWVKEKAVLEKRLKQQQSELKAAQQDNQRLLKTINAADLKRAEAEREAQVLERQLDAFALRLAQGGTSIKPTSATKSASAKSSVRQPSRSGRSRQRSKK